MPDDLKVGGVESLARVSSKLKEAGDKGLQRDMRKALDRAAVPLKEGAPEGAREKLPKRGGLAEAIANAKFSLSVRGGKNPSVRLTGKRTNKTGKQSDLNKIDQGSLRHPVFGKRKVWVLQRVTPDWFSDVPDERLEQARREMVTVFDEFERRL